MNITTVATNLSVNAVYPGSIQILLEAVGRAPYVLLSTSTFRLYSNTTGGNIAKGASNDRATDLTDDADDVTVE